MPNPTREPVAIGGAITAAAAAVLGALRLLEVVPWTAEQTAAVIGAVGAVVALVTALWARSQVTPLAHPRDRDGIPLTPDPGPPSPGMPRLDLDQPPPP